MEEQLNFFKRFNLSFKPSRYSVFLKEKLSKAIIYVLVLSCIIGLIKGLVSQPIISKGEDIILDVLKNENNSFTLKDNILTLKNDTISYEEGSSLILVDTTKTLDSISELDSITVHKDNTVVIVKDGIEVKTVSGKTAGKYSESIISGMYLDNQKLISIIENMSWVKYIMIIFNIIGLFVTIMFNGILISVAGLISDKMNETKLGFENIFKFSLYAMTVPMVLGIVFQVGTLSILIAGFMVVYAIGKVRMKIIQDKVKEEN